MDPITLKTTTLESPWGQKDDTLVTTKTVQFPLLHKNIIFVWVHLFSLKYEL